MSFTSLIGFGQLQQEVKTSIYEWLKEVSPKSVRRNGHACDRGRWLFKSDKNQSRPDIQIAMLPFYFTVTPETGKLVIPKKSGITLSAINVRPQSRGEVKIKSNNPLERPDIDINYLGDDRDVDTLRKCLMVDC